MTERGLFRWLRPWVFPALLIGLFEWYARRAAALGSDSLAPPSAAAKAFAGAAMDGSLWQATGFTLGTAALGLLLGAVVAGAIAIARWLFLFFVPRTGRAPGDSPATSSLWRPS